MLQIGLALAMTAAACSGKTITVAGDGSADFRTIQEAIAAVPDHSTERTIIHVKAGTYSGQIVIPKEKPKV
ncbi:MAG: pectinesterase family protein, partial [Tepidisphaeraceae bacterium]